MKLRELFEEIEVSKDAWTKDEADTRVVSTQSRFDTWKKYLTNKTAVEFADPDYEVVYNKNPGFIVDWEIGIRNKRTKEFVAVLNADEHNQTIDGINLKGKMTSIASVRHDFIGQGLMQKLYQYLLDKGDILFSSTDQSPGGKKLWLKFIENNQDQTFLLINPSLALDIATEYKQLSKFKSDQGKSILAFDGETKSDNPQPVIITATPQVLAKIAYHKKPSMRDRVLILNNRANDSYFVTLPKSSPLLSKLEKIAFKP